MRTSFAETLHKAGRIVIDGSMSTALEQFGADLNHKLWTAKALVRQPWLVKAVHIGYFKAGADCGITCSYQATIPGLTKYMDMTQKEAEEVIARSVSLFLEARNEWWRAEGESAGRVWPLCLGACGPYGAWLADGSEYRGNYGVSDSELRAFHRRRAEIVWESGADLLLFETIPSLREAIIAADLAEEMGVPYWISFSCRDSAYTCEGQALADCARLLGSGHPRLQVLGVNCTQPQFIVPLLGELRRGSDLPLAVYPNSGQVYDPETKTWSVGAAPCPCCGGLYHRPDGRSFGELTLDYFRAGASAAGGCCTTTDFHIRQAAEARDRYLKEYAKA